jgi:superfamily II DNA/RNA helicase
VRVELNKEQISPQSLVHHFRFVGWRNRLDALMEYLKAEMVSQAIIFCNSRHHGQELLRDLRGKFDSLEYIHGGLEQSKRTSIFDRFRRHEMWRVEVLTLVMSVMSLTMTTQQTTKLTLTVREEQGEWDDRALP